MSYGPDAGEPIPSRTPSPRMEAPDVQEHSDSWDDSYDVVARVVRELLGGRDVVPVDEVSETLAECDEELPENALISCTTIEQVNGEWVVTGLSHPDDPPSDGTVEYVQHHD